ncbi:MAG: hypothetical protein ACE5JP_06510 [Candidatus Bipolaricaulia bacterium]
MKRGLTLLVLTVVIVGTLASGAHAQRFLGLGGGVSTYLVNLGPIVTDLNDFEQTLVNDVGLTGVDLSPLIDIIPSEAPVPHLQMRGQVRLPRFIPLFNFLRVDYSTLPQQSFQESMTVEVPLPAPPPPLPPLPPVNVDVVMDAAFNSTVVSVTALKQIGVIFAKLYFGAGVDLVSGALLLNMTVSAGSVDPLIQPVVDAAIDEINNAFQAAGLASNTIETTTTHLVVGGRVGLGFLDLYGELKYLLPLDDTGSLTIGDFEASVGVMLSL